MDFKTSYMSYAAYVGAWLLATAVAILLAFAAPNEPRVTVHLPSLPTPNLKHQPAALLNSPSPGRTMAPITFKGDQRRKFND